MRRLIPLTPLSLSFHMAYRLCRQHVFPDWIGNFQPNYRLKTAHLCRSHVFPDRIGNFQPNYRLKTAQLTKNPPKTYIARKAINQILLQSQLHEYKPKCNLIINYDVMWYTRNLSSISHTHKPHKFCVKNKLTAAENVSSMRLH